jgi:hypothetical protein
VVLEVWKEGAELAGFFGALGGEWYAWGELLTVANFFGNIF